MQSDENRDPTVNLKEFTVTRIRATDAVDIAKLFYRTYGYTYNNEDIYLPKKIERSFLVKEKLGVIARKKDGEAIGYFAVIPRDNSKIAKVAEAVVSPRYRKKMG